MPRWSDAVRPSRPSLLGFREGGRQPLPSGVAPGVGQAFGFDMSKIRIHAAPQRSPAVIRRAGDRSKLTELRDVLDDFDVSESRALTLLGQLDATEKETVRNSPTLRRQMIDAFDAREMLRAVTSLSFSLVWKLYLVKEAGGAGCLSSGDWSDPVVRASPPEIIAVSGWEQNHFIHETRALLEAFALSRPRALLTFVGDGSKRWLAAIKGAGLYPTIVRNLPSGVRVPDDELKALWSLYEDDAELSAQALLDTFHAGFRPRIARAGSEFVQDEGDWAWKYSVATPSAAAMRATIDQFKMLPRAEVDLLEELVFATGRTQVRKVGGAYQPLPNGRTEPSFRPENVGGTTIVLSMAGRAGQAEVPAGKADLMETLRHELGHTVGASFLKLKGGATLRPGDRFAAAYLDWDSASEDEFGAALWTRSDAEPIELDLAGQKRTFQGGDIKSWLIGILKQGRLISPHPLTGPLWGPVAVMAALRKACGEQELVKLLQVLMRNLGNDPKLVHEFPFRLEQYQPPRDRVHLYSFHFDSFASIDRFAFDNVTKTLGFYAIESTNEMFAELYEAWHAGRPVPPARVKNGKVLDPAKFIAMAAGSTGRYDPAEGDPPNVVPEIEEPEAGDSGA